MQHDTLARDTAADDWPLLRPALSESAKFFLLFLVQMSTRHVGCPGIESVRFRKEQCQAKILLSSCTLVA